MTALAFDPSPARTPLHHLQALGQSVWIDWLSRDLLAIGGIEQLVRGYGISGVTTNPTILARAVQTGHEYAAQIHRLATRGLTPETIASELGATDVADACDVLFPTWRATRGRDGYLSWEVPPALAHATHRTIAAAHLLRNRIGRPNLLVKIPATQAGLLALKECTAAGISVNVTLIFSLERHRAVIDAYIRGLELAERAGLDLARIHSVASFFLSRLDTAADERLETLPPAAHTLRGKLGIASAKLAYRQFQEEFRGARWDRLRAAGANPQRCLWASTSTKNPAFSDVMYVEELIGADTVTTLPEQTLEAFADHGRASSTLTESVDDAEAVFRELDARGIDVAAITAACERDGLERFSQSHDGAIEHVRREARRHTWPRG